MRAFSFNKIKGRRGGGGGGGGLRWPDTIYFLKDRLFTTVFYSNFRPLRCGRLSKKECFKFFKSVLLLRSVRINKNFQQFSRTIEAEVFLHITLSRRWNLKDLRGQVSNKSAPRNFHSKR